MKNVTSETAFRENLLHNLRGLKRAVTRPVAINIEDVAVQYDVRDGWQCLHVPTGELLVSNGLTEADAWVSLQDSASFEILIGRRH